MKIQNVGFAAAAVFVVAAVAGSLAVGAGVFAQSVAPVTCSPSTTSVIVGHSVTLTAGGGDGNFVWSSPGMVITNPTGAGFTVAFNAVGTYPVAVTSSGTTATCSIAVMPAPVVPGLPNTGELPE